MCVITEGLEIWFAGLWGRREWPHNKPAGEANRNVPLSEPANAYRLPIAQNLSFSGAILFMPNI